MYELRLDGALAAFSYLGGALKHLELSRTELVRNNYASMRIEQLIYAHAVNSVQRLRSIACDMEMIAAKAAGARAEDVLVENFRADNGYGLDQVSAIINALNPLLNSFKDEASTRFVVSLSQRHASLYGSVGPIFGQEVELAFPNAAEDISEAGVPRCRAVHSRCFPPNACHGMCCAIPLRKARDIKHRARMGKVA